MLYNGINCRLRRDFFWLTEETIITMMILIGKHTTPIHRGVLKSVLPEIHLQTEIHRARLTQDIKKKKEKNTYTKAAAAQKGSPFRYFGYMPCSHNNSYRNDSGNVCCGSQGNKGHEYQKPCVELHFIYILQ